MRKLKVVVMVTALGFSLAVAPAAQAKAKLKTPSAPTVKQVLNYKPKNGKVDVLIKISLPKNNGGSKILGSLVTAGGKSCKMTNLKTSCTIKGLKAGTTYRIKAASRNIKGMGSASEAWVTTTFTMSTWNAVEEAESYLEYSAFSRSGLIDQLEYEGYSTKEAIFAVDSLSINWRKQAVKMAESYLEYSSFSRSELIDQLEYEGFSTSDANYAVRAVGY